MQLPLDGSTRTVPVPNHDELRAGTLRSIVRQSGISKSEFETPSQHNKALHRSCGRRGFFLFSSLRRPQPGERCRSQLAVRSRPIPPSQCAPAETGVPPPAVAPRQIVPSVAQRNRRPASVATDRTRRRTPPRGRRTCDGSAPLLVYRQPPPPRLTQLLVDTPTHTAASCAKTGFPALSATRSLHPVSPPPTDTGTVKRNPYPPTPTRHVP